MSVPCVTARVLPLGMRALSYSVEIEYGDDYPALPRGLILG